MEALELITRKKIRENRIKIIADVFLIIVISLIGIYIFHNIEEFKSLSSDVCRLCEKKTGGQCILTPRTFESSYKNNISASIQDFLNNQSK